MALGCKRRSATELLPGWAGMVLPSGGRWEEANLARACSGRCEGPSFLRAKRTKIQAKPRRQGSEPNSAAMRPSLTRKCSGGLGEGAPEPARARAPAELPPAARVLPEARRIAAAANMAETSEEVAVLVQRVVKDITNAFRRNPHMWVARPAPPGWSGAGRCRALVHSRLPLGAHARFRQAERGRDGRAGPAGRYRDAWRASVGKRPRRATSERRVSCRAGRVLGVVTTLLPAALRPGALAPRATAVGPGAWEAALGCIPCVTVEGYPPHRSFRTLVRVPRGDGRPLLTFPLTCHKIATLVDVTIFEGDLDGSLIKL